MKIIQFSAENVKKLRTVEITPAGSLVQITGRNGSGKSSVLDSILWALTGAREMQRQPIRRGETSARIALDLGTEGQVELKVTRKFTEGGSTLTVESADGARFPAPQAMVDKILGAHSFDPLAFSRQKPREQFDTLRSLVNVDIDFEKFDALQRGDHQKRTELNREVKQLRAQVDAEPAPVGEIPAPTDTAALFDELENAGKHNTTRDRDEFGRKETERWIVDTRQKADTTRAAAADKRRQAVDLITAAEHLEVEAERLNASAADMRAKIEGLPNLPALIGPEHIKEIKTRLAQAEATNRANEREQERRARRELLVKKLTAVEVESSKLSHRIDTRERQKNEAIAAAEMPVPGIGFGDGSVLLNGLPFEQASSAEQLRASAAIAMAANPTLRVLRIKDGSLLDEEGLKLLAELAAAKDYQIWIERVDTSGAVGFVMDEGEVRAPADIDPRTVPADPTKVHRMEAEPVLSLETPKSDEPTPIDGDADQAEDEHDESPCEYCGQIGECDSPTCDECGERHCGECVLEELAAGDPYRCPKCGQLAECAGEECMLCRNGIPARAASEVSA